MGDSIINRQHYRVSRVQITYRLEIGRSSGHHATREIVRWLVAFVATAICAAISFVWLDRPIATYVHVHNMRPQQALLEQLTHMPDPLIPIAVVALAIIGLRILTKRPLIRLEIAGFLCSLSVLFAETIKDQLKFLFGRTWPESWAHLDPSFIGTGAYGFNWLHGGAAYESFPSGHMGATCAVVSVLWIWYPQWRALWVLAGFVVAVALIGGNYHFLSDVIAGAFVGGSTGWITTMLWTSWLSLRFPRAPKLDGAHSAENRIRN
ncbi:MAG TPA: phosphatase PAP2 family protein [Pseudolabrys sp.]|jgi:membrane-associated phospholipid phosphatase